MELLEKANRVYLENFKPITWFGRCIFLSWYCEKGTCNFCFRSTIKHKIKHASGAKRTMSSILCDAIIGKNLNWRLEFLTGGYGIYSFEEILDIAKHVSKVFGYKLWVNLGVLTGEEMKKLKPYVEGVCASIETVEPELHKKICPDKPIEPYSKMLKTADNLGLKKSITVVIGLGEKKEYIDLLFDFIEEHKLNRITFYALKPIKGTPFTKSPDIKDYVWWIAKTRINFPKIEIIAGLTPKNANFAEEIFKAGANAITKFPVVKQFNSKNAKLIEHIVKKSGRKFLSNLTKLPDVDWDKKVEELNLEKNLEKKTKDKLREYISYMKKA